MRPLRHSVARRDPARAPARGSCPGGVMLAARAALVLLLAGASACFRFDVEPLPNGPPQAIVVAEHTAVVGAEVVLDGSSSVDADGNTLTFEWAQESGAPVSLRNSRTAVVAFTAPPEPQALYFSLIVNDGA